MATATLSTKGQMIIPFKIRQRFHLKPKDKIEIQVKGDDIILHPIPENPVEACFGALKVKEPTESLVRAARKEEREIEKRKWRK